MQAALYASFYLFYIFLVYLFIALITFLFAAAGWEFGFRDGYINILIYIFEFSRRKIETTESTTRCHDETTDNEGDGGTGSDTTISNSDERFSCNNKNSSSENRNEKSTSSDVTINTHIDGDFKRPYYHEHNSSRSRADNSSSDRLYGTQQESETDKNNGKDIKVRKQSTIRPGGAPIFLLDEESASQHEFRLSDACILIQKGIEAIVDDEVTKCFDTEELSSWNLLTRNNRSYHFTSLSLSCLYFIGFAIRYMIFFPLRAIFTTLGILWLIICTFAVGCLPARIRPKVYWVVSLMCFRMLSCGITAVLKFHNRQYRAKGGDICVANHTSPIDVVVLACDNCYALVGQKHTGLLGVLERALSRAATHVWFDRSEMRDRQYVVNRLKEHVADRNKMPILIFPEGTCINNSAVMMFKKGSFEASDRVCPVAIKYDSRFGDPFWNSSRQGWVQYLLLMMTSWAIKCDVWYLPPMVRQDNESAVEFASRVKSEIARQGGLVDLAWDGQLKRTLAKTEWREKQQEDFSRRLKID